MESRIAELEKQITTLVKYVHDVNKAIADGFEKSSNNFEKITANLKVIEADLAIVNAKINKLDKNTSISLETVDVKLDDLKTEINKIGSVTGYDDMLENMKVIK